MAATTIRPDARLKSKFFLITAVSGLPVVLGSVAFGAGVGYDAGGIDGAWIGGAIALGANLLWLVPVLLIIPPYYRSLRYEIHEDEVIVRVGVITKSVKHVPFRTVTNIQVNRGPFDRIYGLGTLQIQTAGFSGKTGAEESLIGLRNYQAAYDQVAVALRRFRSAMAPTQAETETPPQDGVVLSAILTELQAIRKAVEKGQ